MQKKESFIKQVYKELPEEYRDDLESIAVGAIIIFIVGSIAMLSMFIAANILPVYASVAEKIFHTLLVFFAILFGIGLITVIIEYAIKGVKAIFVFFKEFQAAVERVEQKNNPIQNNAETKNDLSSVPKFLENKKIMEENEMIEFINSIDRVELQMEMKELEKSNIGRFPRYLKAVKVSLISLGYDEEWVESVFASALLKKYF